MGRRRSPPIDTPDRLPPEPDEPDGDSGADATSSADAEPPELPLDEAAIDAALDELAAAVEPTGQADDAVASEAGAAPTATTRWHDYGYRRAAAKVREFPRTPGVYLMKDAAGRVIYVGKAKSLRARAGSYFLKAALDDRRTADLVREICDIDCLECESEVDALLAEARLIKDIQPKFNVDLKDDKTFPYLEIITREDFPRVQFTRQPHLKGTRLYGPFANAGSLRGAIAVLHTNFKFHTSTLDIDDVDEK